MIRPKLLIAALLIPVSVTAFAADPTPPVAKVYDLWPFDSAEAAARQADTAKATGDVDPIGVRVGDVVINFRLIPAGKFEQGSPTTENGHEGDERLRPITIAEPFYMMETQLTVAAYRALMKADPAGMPADADAKLPAAVAYRDTMDNVLPALHKVAPPGWKVILPDQSRLEYAARAGVATMNPGGNAEKDAGDYAWTKENSDDRPHPVAAKKANAWGLYDVIGNRWHWVWAGAGGGYGDASKDNHLVYGGTYNTPANGNGARLANIMISKRAEGVRFALIRVGSRAPKGHPDPKP
jgi:hypothetical protein